MKSISIQYQELKEGKINKHQFLRNARMMFPNFVTNHNSFEDSVKILTNKGLLNEGDAVKGTPDKAPSYDYPTQPAKYKKVVQEPEVDEQDGIYPATTLTDIPKEEVSKPIKSKNRPDGLEPIKNKDTKNEMKKVGSINESAEKSKLREAIKKIIRETLGEISQKKTLKEIADTDSQYIEFEIYDVDIDNEKLDLFGTLKVNAEKEPANYIDGYLESGDYWYITDVELENLEAAYNSTTEEEITSPEELKRLEDIVSNDRRINGKLYDYAERYTDLDRFEGGEPDPDRYHDDY